MKGYVSTSWGQLHYRAAGLEHSQAQLSLVMLHESPRSSMVYTPVLEELGRMLPVYAFDTPGFGMSDSAPDDAPIADYARIFLEAIDALGIGRFVILGMKTGSYLGSHLIEAAGPKRVGAAILYAMAGPDADRQERYARTWAPDLDIPEDGSLFTRLWAKNVGIYGTASPRDLSMCVAEAVINIDRYNSIYPATFRSHDRTWRLITEYSKLIPITILVPDGAQMTPEEQVELVSIPGTREVLMPAKGQFASQCPGPFTAAIREAISAVSAADVS